MRRPDLWPYFAFAMAERIDNFDALLAEQVASERAKKQTPAQRTTKWRSKLTPQQKEYIRLNQKANDIIRKANIMTKTPERTSGKKRKDLSLEDVQEVLSYSTTKAQKRHDNLETAYFKLADSNANLQEQDKEQRAILNNIVVYKLSQVMTPQGVPPTPGSLRGHASPVGKAAVRRTLFNTPNLSNLSAIAEDHEFDEKEMDETIATTATASSLPSPVAATTGE